MSEGDPRDDAGAKRREEEGGLELVFPDRSETVKFGAGGWVRYRARGQQAEAYVRLIKLSSGRLGIGEVRLLAPEGVTSGSLRNLPLGKLEALANYPGAGFRAVVGWLTERPAQSPDEAFRSMDPESVVLEPNSKVASAMSEALTEMAILLREDTPPLRKPRMRLRIPIGRKKPDDFYRQVAEAYSYLGGQSRRPAEELAARNAVPVTTVHRWVKEARRRGLLPPARHGRKEEGHV
jgi:hypothetical protein